jgi:nitroreductase
MMRIIHQYHPIEKGLAMPKMRLGFGKENILNLIEDCYAYKDRFLALAAQRYSAGFQHYNQALSILSEYKQVHLDAGFELESNFLEKIDTLTKGLGSDFIYHQIETTREDYFRDADSSFKNFSSSRHSLRNFVGKIKNEDLEKAIELAQNAPSACNRQPGRVHVVENEVLKQKVLDIQGGNSGFGSMADKVLIVAVETAGYRGLAERNGMFVDGGIYAMNLLYALHSFRIGACPLNWSSTPEKDILLRKTILISESQTVIMMIACGSPPDKFKLAYSKRSSVDTVIVNHA